MKIFPALALTCVLAASAARAELALETPVIELKPKPEEERVTVNFVFHNRGGRPVAVKSIDSACSCLSASLDKAVYQPGEKGTGRAEFLVSSFVGRYEKTVQVQTDDPAQPEWVIPFAIEIPEVVRMEPGTLQWWVGNPVETLKARMTVLADTPLKITGITPFRQPSNVEFSWREVTPGREYEITVTPTSLTEVTLGALLIHTDSKVPKYQNQQLIYSIYRKPPRP